LAGTRAQPSQATGTALARCIPGKFLGVVCHCFPLPLDVPNFAARCASAPSSERWNCGREWSGNFAEMTPFFTPFRDRLHAANLRHGANGFTSLPKKDLFARKIRRLRPGANPRFWVPKASMLNTIYIYNMLLKKLDRAWGANLCIGMSLKKLLSQKPQVQNISSDSMITCLDVGEVSSPNLRLHPANRHPNSAAHTSNSSETADQTVHPQTSHRHSTGLQQIISSHRSLLG
jgi:hypothetical protein